MDNKIDNQKKEEIQIDLSNVSNLSAVKGRNPAIEALTEKVSKSSSVTKEEKVSKLISDGYKVEKFEKYPRKFEFVPADKIQLPSRGLPYKTCEDKDVREGFVYIYPLTMKEEEILSTSKYINEGTATIMALNNCLKSNIDAMDLIVSDFYYLMMYLRQISISDKFTFNITCPHCGKDFKHEIKISDQKFDDLNPETFQEPIRVDLPKTDYTVLLGLPRIRTIREMSWLLTEKKSVGVADFLFTRTIAIISPDGQEVPKEDWIIFYNNLPHEDAEIILQQAQFDNGLTHIVSRAVCPECGKEIEGSEINLNADELFRYE